MSEPSRFKSLYFWSGYFNDKSKSAVLKFRNWDYDEISVNDPN